MSQLQPVPHKAQIIDVDGLPSRSWADWFQKVYSYLGPEGWSKDQSQIGYQKLPTGLYLQWGTTGLLATATTTSVNLPKAFPNACVQVIVGINNNPSGSTAATGHFGTGNYSTSAFEIYNRTTENNVFNWFALGY